MLPLGLKRVGMLGRRVLLNARYRRIFPDLSVPLLFLTLSETLTNFSPSDIIGTRHSGAFNENEGGHRDKVMENIPPHPP
jgi:hypothetical protein